jgi:hypothetical protein
MKLLPNEERLLRNVAEHEGDSVCIFRALDEQSLRTLKLYSLVFTACGGLFLTALGVAHLRALDGGP